MRQISTTPIFRSTDASNGSRGSATSPKSSQQQQQQHNYSTAFNWANPAKGARPPPADNTEIKKPDLSVYEDDIFGPDIDFEADELNKNNKAIEERPPPTRPPMRLVPRTGRTVHVTKNVDVARSFKLLAIQTAQNRLRQDFQYQRFHERPGLKRKRLKSERWQKRFKRGFKACVSKVKELTKQGW